jgi:hypothetical protein
MLLNPLPDPEPPELFIINPLLDGLEVGGGPPPENPERPPPPLPALPPLPNPESRPKSNEELLPIKLDSLEVLELLGSPPPPPGLFELLKLLKPKPFC